VNTSPQDTTLSLQELDFDIISIKQMTVELPSH
jgi:hypothetical protein